MRLLFDLEIELAPGRSAVVQVHDGLEPIDIARQFAEGRDLPESAIISLADFISAEVGKRQRQPVVNQPYQRHHAQQLFPKAKTDKQMTEREKAKLFSRLASERRQQLFETLKHQSYVIQSHDRPLIISAKNSTIESGSSTSDKSAYESFTVPLNIAVETKQLLKSKQAKEESKKQLVRTSQHMTEVFSRLHNDAKLIQQKKEIAEHEAFSRKQQKKTTDNDFVYNTSKVWRAEADAKIDRLRRQRYDDRLKAEQDEMQQCTFQPVISDHAKSMTLTDSVYLRLSKQAETQNSRTLKLQKELKERDLSYTFKPALKVDPALSYRMDVTIGSMYKRPTEPRKVGEVPVLFIDK